MSFTRFLNNGGGGGTQGFSRFLSSNNQTQDNPYDPAKLDRQIENANVRIQDAGYKQQDSDRRNWFEKATNLPQNQNWFFDTLEILGRPSNAIKNVIDKTMVDKTENVGQALYRGLSGQENVSGSELAGKAGVENKVGKFLLGTGLDIALDPITYVPGGVIAKGIKGGAGIASKPIKAGYEALENASPALKNLRETRLAPATESTKDALGYMFNPDYKKTETLFGGQSDVLKNLERETENTRRYMQEEALGNVVNLAKKTGVDTGVDAGRLMEAPLKQFEDVKAYEFPNGLKVTENKADLLNEMKLNREKAKTVGKEVSSTTSEYQKAIREFVDGLNKTDAEIKKLYMGIERLAGKEADKATRSNLREAGRELSRVESKLNNFDQNEQSLLRNFKKQVRDNHEMQFDLIKQIRHVAPNGLKDVVRSELPGSLQNFVRSSGKGIDEVANELGYSYADDLIQDLKKLNGVPRRLDNQTVERIAKNEMERTGAFKHLELTKKELELTRNTLNSSMKEIRKSAPKTNAERATEKAFADLSQDPKYMELSAQRNALKGQLDSLKGESKQAKQAKIEQIKQIENEITALREAADNPVMIQKELPRPQREMPADPKIQEAAANLTKSNDVLRQYAVDNGIDIKEMEGYMTHVWSQAERDLRKSQRKFAVDQGRYGIGNPNKKILNERGHLGSAEDVNERLGKSLFEPNAYFATATGQKRLIDYVQATQFRRKVLSNPDFAVKFEKGMEVQHNAVVIDTNNYKFLKESGDLLDGVVQAEKIGGQYIVTKAAKQALDRFQHINTDEGTKAFIKGYGNLQNTWKKLALFSPGYHVRNFVGNMWNSYAAGMRPDQLTKYTSESIAEVTNALKGKESAMFNEFRKQGLLFSGFTKIEMGSSKPAEQVIENAVKKMSKEGIAKAADKVKNPFETSKELGESADMINRYAMYKWARERGMDTRKAADKVREALFDYADLTPFEQKVMRNIFPFYTWTRKNIPFQVKSFMEHPDRFQKLNYVRKEAQENTGLNEENTPDYMKENFYMPVFGKDGKGKVLGLNLPSGDLAKMGNPLKLGSDLLTPLIKTPLELASNYNTFKGRKIKEFEGQEKKLQIPGTNKEIGIPIQLAYALEQGTGQVGRGVSTFLQKPENENQDNKFRTPSLGVSSFLKDFDAEKYDYYKKLDDLKKLQDLIRYIEQQEGQKPRTLAEIKKAR